jgi:AbrB family looped-hinge helix DNA binding protein
MSRKTYIIQESGSVTLPAEFRKKYGLQPGDEVTFVETDAGLLISPREALIKRLLDDINDDLEAQGVTLDALMAAGRAQRDELLKRLYGVEVEDEA